MWGTAKNLLLKTEEKKRAPIVDPENSGEEEEKNATPQAKSIYDLIENFTKGLIFI